MMLICPFSSGMECSVRKKKESIVKTLCWVLINPCASPTGQKWQFLGFFNFCVLSIRILYEICTAGLKDSCVMYIGPAAL